MNGNDVGRNAYSNKARTKAFFFIKAMKIILIMDYSNCGGSIYASGIRLCTLLYAATVRSWCRIHTRQTADEIFRPSVAPEPDGREFNSLERCITLIAGCESTN